MPVLPSYRNRQLICCANQWTGFYIRAALAFNGLKVKGKLESLMKLEEVFFKNSIEDHHWEMENENIKDVF